MSMAILVVVLFTFFLALDSINTIKNISKLNIKTYQEEAYLNKQKELKNYVSIAHTTVQSIHDRGTKREIEKDLKDHTTQLFHIITKVYLKFKDKIPKEELQEKLKFIISNARFGDNGYYWINDLNFKMIMHPIHPEFVGKDFSNAKDENGVYFIQEAVKVSKTKDEGYIHYIWKKPNSMKAEPKISFVKIFKPYGWVLGSGVYVNDIREALKRETIDTISKMRYGKSGYFWINDMTPKMIMHPILPQLDGKDLSTYKDPDGIYLFKEMIKVCKRNKDGGIVKYSWIKPGHKIPQEKLSYVQKFEAWNWIIGSGAYVDDIENQINMMKNQTKSDIKNVIRSFFDKIIFSVIIIIIIIHILVKQNIIIPMQSFQTSFMSFFDYINSKSKDIILSQNKSKDEIGQMSQILNNNILIAKEKFDEESKLKEKLKELNSKLKVKIKDEVKKSHNIEEKLFESEKMASMGEMIGNIAHQWRQPLSVISTASTGIIVQKEFGGLSDEKLIIACESINENAQYLSKTIDDFKNFIKGERIKRSFKIEDEINSLLKLIEGSAKNNNINIILDLQKDVFINSYENELTQCMMNIFNNAKDALIENIKTKRYIFITTKKIDNKVIITIKDNANGIPNSVLPKIFDPYFTTKHKSKGTGLGLHMTYNLIVNGMNGSIEASNIEYEYENNKYKGAIFKIVLPLV
jgi:signal transduction histidine kinase